MARNKVGKELAAKMKENEDKVVLEEVDNGIVETTTNPDPKKHVRRAIRRAAAAIRRAARKRHEKNKRDKSTIVDPTTKTYKVLVQYHQLNYEMIKAALEEGKFTPSVIDNSRFWINKLSYEDLEKLKEAMRSCHFKTKQGKEYKVRLAAYRYVESKDTTDKKEKKPSANTKEAKVAARTARKQNNLARAKAKIGHKSRRAKASMLRSQKKKKVNHKPATIDTSTIAKIISKRAKKAVQAIERKEKEKAVQAKSRASKGIPKPKKGSAGKQLKIAA